MPTYAVLLEQAEDGCDYMIDCGKTWKIFEAEDLQHAHIKARQIVMDGDVEEGWLEIWNEDRTCGYAALVEIKAILPTVSWFNEFYTQQAEIKNQAKVNAEMEEFKRLKAKYGKQ